MKTLTLPPTPPWTLTPFLRVSLGVHVAAGLAALAWPAAWPWALGAVVLNHVALSTCGLLPRSQWLGANLSRLPAAAAARKEWALTIDDGPDPEVTPQVLDLLDRLDTRATFFCIARLAAAHPALVRDIVARGHSVQNHSFWHRHNFSLLGPRGFEREILRAQEQLQALSGQRPNCFRAPAGLRNPFLAPVLHRLGLHLVSWTRRAYDTRVGAPEQVLARLTRDFAAGDILLLHDGHAARTPQGRPVLLEVLPELVAHARRLGLRAVTLPAALGH